jgi:hypothetical protein
LRVALTPVLAGLLRHGVVDALILAGAAEHQPGRL